MSMSKKPNLASKEYQYGFHDDYQNVFTAGKGLTRHLVEEISSMKNEPEWMKKFRLKSLDIYEKKPMPSWGDTELLALLDLDNIRYYVRPSEKTERNWDDVPETIKKTFEKLGIPEAERRFLAG